MVNQYFNVRHKTYIDLMLKVLNLEHITVNIIRYDLDKFNTDDIKIKAILDKTPFDKTTFNLLLGNSFRWGYKSIFRHEMGHIQQYASGELSNVKGGWIFNDKFISNNSNYKSRPHELDANVKARDIKRLLRKLKRSLKRKC